MPEQGNPADWQAGLRHLSHARQLAAEGLPAAEAGRVAARIAALQTDLEEQAATAGDTLEGVFPLAPLLTSSPFVASGPAATYQLVGDPALKATADAATDLQSRATEWIKDRRQVQLPVLFISVPQNQVLEDWVLRMFRTSPRFRVYTSCGGGRRTDSGGTGRSLGRPHHARRQGRLVEGIRSDEIAGGHDSPRRCHRGHLPLRNRRAASGRRQQLAAGTVLDHGIQPRSPRPAGLDRVGQRCAVGAGSGRLRVDRSHASRVGRRHLMVDPVVGAAGRFRRGTHPALRDCSAAGIDAARAGNAAGGCLLVSVAGGIWA